MDEKKEMAQITITETENGLRVDVKGKSLKELASCCCPPVGCGAGTSVCCPPPDQEK